MPCCGPVHIFRRFILTTSIRGARHVLESESRWLRLFWAAFIVLSVLGVLTVSAFSVKSYLTFDTVVQRSKKPFHRQHFPAVTICSDGFFGKNRDAHMLLAHPAAYKRLVNSFIKDALLRADEKSIQALMTLKSTVLYNVNNNWILKPLLDSFLQRKHAKEFKNTAANKVLSIICNVQSQTNSKKCEMRPQFDFRYRNCLTFEMPRQSVTNMSQQQQMEIVIPVLTLKAPVEFAADLLHLKPLLGRFVFVFLHEVGTLPPRVPTTFVSASSYSSALINFDVTLIKSITTPPDPCHTEDQVLYASHAGRNVVEDTWTCSQKELQTRVRRRCGCEWWGPPLGANWADKDRRPAFCGTFRARNVTVVVQELLCLQQEEARLEADLDSDHADLQHCLQPCSRLEYDSPRVFLDTMDRSKYRELLNEYRALIFSETMFHRCSNNGSKSDACQKVTAVVSTLMHQVAAADNWPPTANSLTLKVKDRQTKNAKRDELLKNWLRVVPDMDNRLLWWKAYPNGTDFKLNASTDFNLLSQRLILRPGSWEVQVDQYTLVRTKWMTLGQVGGAASFLAGLSLTVLAELIDACCYYRKIRRLEEEKCAAPQSEVEVSVICKDEHQEVYWSMPKIESPM